ncbi:hypothetical protein [Massilia aquatica]|uniref:Uncharacterized protein n=1 Tax=Massilia aquatica TaxID=2609000 RepID=A0ABX0M275_9BURK|nr:hypothetical protein [Massilia aquatica]NHZ41264.1 hypothetical protein [Massilia aquatica]
MPTITCNFKFKCPQEWSQLDATETDGVRFCTSCDSKVYLVTSSAEVEQHARDNRCVALLDNAVMVLGMPKGYTEWYLLVLAQEYSPKQLYLLRRIWPHLTSVPATREEFYMKEVKFEALDMAPALAYQAALGELGIASRVGEYDPWRP